MSRKYALTALLLCLSAFNTAAQTYQQRLAPEQQAYVKEKVHRLAATISGRQVEFTPEFLALVNARVAGYAKRIGNNMQGVAGKEDLRFVIERGAQYAPAFAKIFQARNVAPLLGVYLPFMESEFRNDLVSGAGSSGMFQFMEQTAGRYGLAAAERNNPAKAADAAARYLKDMQARFAGDVWLSFLAYNQGEMAVEKMLNAVPAARGAACGLCALSAANGTLGKEGLWYTPSMLAAAIIGENPADFGLAMAPLSGTSANK